VPISKYIKKNGQSRVWYAVASGSVATHYTQNKIKLFITFNNNHYYRLLQGIFCIYILFCI